MKQTESSEDKQSVMGSELTKKENFSIQLNEENKVHT